MATHFQRSKRSQCSGFSLIELGTVLCIVSILVAMAINAFWNTEGADAALVRSVQTQLQTGAIQAATQTGDLPTDTGNLVTLAAYIVEQMDGQANVTMDCSDGGGVCHLTLGAKGADLLVNANGSVDVTSLSGFSHFGVADGDVAAL